MSSVDKSKAHIDAARESEYMLTPVPMSGRRPTFSQVMVWVGFGYVVTGLYVGSVLGGFGGKGGATPAVAIMGIVLGMGSLFLITSFLGIAAQKTGMNLALISRYSYGRQGFVIPMGIMALLTFGWFASIVGMVGDIWGTFIGNPTGIIVFEPSNLGYQGIAPITLEVFLSCFVWGLIFTVTAVIGIKAIEAVAIPVAPVIMVIAAAVGVGMMREGGGFASFLNKANSLGELGLSRAITVVVGSWIAGAVMGVDLFRFNKNVRAVFLCAASCFILTNPLLNIVGYIGTVQVGQYNYVAWLMGVSAFWSLAGVIAWTTSLWTTNNAELYCNALYTGPALDSFGIKANRKVLVAVCGVLGSIVGSLAFYQIFFADFINALGAMAPPVCAPILADYFLISGKSKAKYDASLLDKQPKVRWAGVISFAVGAGSGFAFEYVFSTPYNLPSGLLAMLISFIVYCVIYQYAPDKKNDRDMVRTLTA